jgi:hypothetical protein
MSHEHNAEKVMTVRDICTASFENMVKFKQLGITNQICMHEEIKIRLSPAISVTIHSCLHVKL